MIESWAEGVETIVTNDRYLGLDPDYIATNSVNTTTFRFWNDWRQNSEALRMNEYTPIVADLIDDFNQNLENPDFPIDEVSGYTLQQIQSALNNSRNLEQWRQKLQWNFDNPTENNLEELFNYVNEVYENL